MPIKCIIIYDTEKMLKTLGATINMEKLRMKQSVKFLVALPWEKTIRSGMRSHFIYPRVHLKTKWRSWQEGDCAALMVPSVLRKVVPTRAWP